MDEAGAVSQGIDNGRERTRAAVNESGGAKLGGDDSREVIARVDGDGRDAAAGVLDSFEMAGRVVSKGSTAAKRAVDVLHQVEAAIPGECPAHAGPVTNGSQETGRVVGESRAIGLGLCPTGGQGADQCVLARSTRAIRGSVVGVGVHASRHGQVDRGRIDGALCDGKAVIVGRPRLAQLG